MKNRILISIALAIAAVVCATRSARIRALFPRLALPATWAALSLALLFAAPNARAQGTLYRAEVRSTAGAVVPGATVTVCAYVSSQYAGGAYTGAIPCTPTAAIYNEPTLSVSQSNPVTSNSRGEFFFYAAAGAYTITEQGSGIISKGYQVTLACVPGSTSAQCGSGGGGTSGNPISINGVPLGPGVTANFNNTTPSAPAGSNNAALSNSGGSIAISYVPGSGSGGGGGTPCTTNANSLQYNNAGVFGCIPTWTFPGSGLMQANQFANGIDLIDSNAFQATPSGFFFRAFDSTGTTLQASQDYQGNGFELTSETVGSTTAPGSESVGSPSTASGQNTDFVHGGAGANNITPGCRGLGTSPADGVKVYLNAGLVGLPFVTIGSCASADSPNVLAPAGSLTNTYQTAGYPIQAPSGSSLGDFESPIQNVCGTACTDNLPATPRAGFRFFGFNFGAGTVTYLPAAGNTVNNAASIALTTNQWAIFTFDGVSNWVAMIAGTGGGGSGTLTNFSFNTTNCLTPAFSCSVATATTTPVASFTALAIPANQVLGNCTTGSAVWTNCSITPAMLPSVYQTIKAAGVALTQRTVVNFLSNMSCSDNSGATPPETDCTPSGGGGGGGPISTIQGTVNQVDVVGGTGPTATISLDSTLKIPGTVGAVNGISTTSQNGYGIPIYNNDFGSQNTAVASTTMYTTPNNGVNGQYSLMFSVVAIDGGVACTGTGHVTTNLIYTDPHSGATQPSTQLVSLNIGNGNTSSQLTLPTTAGGVTATDQGYGSEPYFLASPNTTISISTTFIAGSGCTTAQHYDLAAQLLKW